MTLQELKTLLRIDHNFDDDYLQLMLEAMLEYVKDHCNNDFPDGIPGGVKIAIARAVEYTGQNLDVQSERLGDYSVTGTIATNWSNFPPQIRSMLRPYRRLKSV